MLVEKKVIFRSVRVGIALVVVSTLGSIRLLEAEEKAENKSRKFKEEAREELDRLKNLPEERDEVSEDSAVDDLFEGAGQAPIMMPRTVQREEDREKKEKEEEKRKKGENWLLEGYEKVSGERKLTEEEKASLQNPGSETRLIDRIVLEEAAEVERTELQEAENEKDFARGLEDSAAGDLLPDAPGIANESKGERDPLKEMEERYSVADLRKNLDALRQGDDRAQDTVRDPSQNPFLEAMSQENSVSASETKSLWGGSQRIRPGELRRSGGDAARDVGKSMRLDSHGVSSAQQKPYFSTKDEYSVPLAGRQLRPAPLMPSASRSTATPSSSVRPRERETAPKTYEGYRYYYLTEQEHEKYFPRLKRF